MSVTTPRLTLGLPVYNGERFLAESLDALLAQTFTDFELIISDNGSTDRTSEIAREYQSSDPRVRYVRHDQNRGSTFNHNFVIEQAAANSSSGYPTTICTRQICSSGASMPSTPGPRLSSHMPGRRSSTKRARSLTAHRLRADDRRSDPVERFRSVLYTDGGDDIYGVIRMSVLRQIAPFDSYHWADRTFVAELALHGPFHNVPEFLYFRRDHPSVRRRWDVTTSGGGVPGWTRRGRTVGDILSCVSSGNIVLGYVSAIRRAPTLSTGPSAVHEGASRLDCPSCQSEAQGASRMRPDPPAQPRSSPRSPRRGKPLKSASAMSSEPAEQTGRSIR